VNKFMIVAVYPQLLDIMWDLQLSRVIGAISYSAETPKAVPL